MAISMNLRVLARKLEKGSDDLLIEASNKNPDIFEKVATAVAAASTLLEEVADDIDQNASLEITPKQLDELAALASAFDVSEDPFLKKQASVLDELLVTLGSSKHALAQVSKEDELNRIRAERRKARGEEAYEAPRKAHAELSKSKEIAKAVEQQVKRYIPLEAPLQTRYPPDRPGGQLARIADGVYQDLLTGIIYDYKQGYKTQKGNEIPGGSVENQTRDFNDYRNQGTSLFETRQSLMGRYASDDLGLQKYANGNSIGKCLLMARDWSIQTGNKIFIKAAIDSAMKEGLNTSEVGAILASNIKTAQRSEVFLPSTDPSEITDEEILVRNNELNKWDPLKDLEDKPKQVEFETLSIDESAENYINAITLLSAIEKSGVGEGWIKDQIYSMYGAGTLLPFVNVLRAYFLWKPLLSKITGEPINKKPSILYFEDQFLPPEYKEALDKAIDRMESGKSTIVPTSSDRISTKNFTEIPDEPIPYWDSVARQSSIGLVINAIKELAPHLLKEAVELAEKDGMSQEYIRSVLAKDIKNDYRKGLGEQDEIKIAETIFPILKSLGWNSLVTKHLNIMASVGVSKSLINKLAGTYCPKALAIPSFDHLRSILKRAGVAELDLEDNDKDFEEIDIDSEPVSGDKPVFPGPIPVETPKVKLTSGLITPLDDAEKWNATYKSIRQSLMSSPQVAVWKQQVSSGNREEAEQEYKDLFDAKMNYQGLVGPFELDGSGKTWLSVIKTTLSDGPATIPVKQTPIGISKTDPVPTVEGVWAHYQKQYGISPENVQKIHDLVKKSLIKEKEKIDDVFSARIDGKIRKYPGVDIPVSIQKLFAEMPESKDLVYGMFERFESVAAVEIALAKFIAEKIKSSGKHDGAVKAIQDELIISAKKDLEEYERQSASMPEKVEKVKAGIQDKTQSINNIIASFEEQIRQLPPGDTDKKQEIEDKIKVAQQELREAERSAQAMISNTEGKVKEILSRSKRTSAKAARPDQILKEIINKEIGQIMPPVKDLIDTAKSLTGPVNKRKAEDLRRQYLTDISKVLYNAILARNGLPPIFPDAKYIPLSEFSAKLLEFASGGKSKQEVFRLPPDGLTTFWDDPNGYMDALKEAREAFPWKKELTPEQKAERNEEMDSLMSALGYVPPFMKLWGKTSTAALLYGVKDYTIPDFGELKTLFSNPAEYIKKYTEGKKNPKFKAERKNIPKEWDLIEEATKGGEVVRKMIKGMIFGGASLEEIKNNLKEKYPKAVLPEGILDFIYQELSDEFTASRRARKEFNNWMEEQGYYPPDKPVLGTKTFRNIIDPKRNFQQSPIQMPKEKSMGEMKEERKKIDTGTDAGVEQGAFGGGPESVISDNKKVKTFFGDEKGWVSSFNNARGAMKREVPEMWSKYNEEVAFAKKKGQRSEGVGTDAYRAFINDHMWQNGWAPAFEKAVVSSGEINKSWAALAYELGLFKAFGGAKAFRTRS
ncbi:MAG: hypothetical protein WC942_05335 [Clostridia bacterium]|jgi:hypothetical protein